MIFAVLFLSQSIIFIEFYRRYYPLCYNRKLINGACLLRSDISNGKALSWVPFAYT